MRNLHGTSCPYHPKNVESGINGQLLASPVCKHTAWSTTPTPRKAPPKLPTSISPHVPKLERVKTLTHAIGFHYKTNLQPLLYARRGSQGRNPWNSWYPCCAKYSTEPTPWKRGLWIPAHRDFSSTIFIQEARMPRPHRTAQSLPHHYQSMLRGPSDATPKPHRPPTPCIPRERSSGARHLQYQQHHQHHH